MLLEVVPALEHVGVSGTLLEAARALRSVVEQLDQGQCFYIVSLVLVLMQSSL